MYVYRLYVNWHNALGKYEPELITCRIFGDNSNRGFGLTIHQTRTHAVFIFRSMLKQKECGNNLRGEDGLKKTPSVCSAFNFTSRTCTCNEQGVCLPTFQQMGYFTNVCRLWILATLWGKVHLSEHRPSPFPTVITTKQNNRTRLFTYQVETGWCSSTSR